MAQQTIVTLIDDMTGEQAAETVHFGVDGVQYEIDLTEENAARLREALAEFMRNGRKVAKLPKSLISKASGRTQQTPDRRVQTQAIREWAHKQGHQLANRGRIPQGIVAEFEAAHAS